MASFFAGSLNVNMSRFDPGRAVELIEEQRASILFEFSPRPEYKAKSKELKFLKKVRGKAWICDDDYQLIRVEAETIETIAFGLGILVRLHKGARLTFQRQRVNDEIWLPSVAQFAGKGRILLLKGFRFEGTSEYSDYQKFTVQSSISFAPSKKAD